MTAGMPNQVLQNGFMQLGPSILSSCTYTDHSLLWTLANPLLPG